LTSIFFLDYFKFDFFYKLIIQRLIYYQWVFTFSTFVFVFLYIRLSQSYAHDHRVKGLTWLDSNNFFICFFLFNFFQFCYSILHCLIIDLHCFIRFSFEGITLVSWPSHKFSMLTWMGSKWDFFYHFFFSLFIVIGFFLLKLSKLCKHIKLNQVNDTGLSLFSSLGTFELP